MFFLFLIFSLLFNTIAERKCPSRLSIEQSLSNAHIPGAVILVMNKSDILYDDTFGYHSFSPIRLMNTDKSIFALASISKTFISVSVMQLVQLNLVDLDRDINEYLSSSNQRIFHPLYPLHKITLRQLLSHSASINRNDQMEGLFVQLGDVGLTSTGLADVCYQYLHPNSSNWLTYPPGSVTLYSNIGSSLAALVVERVTQMPYEKYIKEKILKPLKINTNEAGFRLSDFANRDDLVNHYTFNASRLEYLNEIFPQLDLKQVDCSNWISIPFYGPSFYPANLLRISGRSLSKYVRMFMNNGSNILHPNSIKTIKTIVEGVIPYEQIHSNQSFPSIEYGLIWNWRTIDNQRYIGHTGNMPGVANSFMINENDNTAVIILTNGDTTLNNGLTKTISDLLTNIQVSLIHCYQNFK